MPDNDLIEIRVSRIIPAEKWKLIRFFTNVQEFPKFIATVKEASIVQKARNKMRTRWRVQVDKVPISWVEEDTLLLKQGIILFRAIEGDLEKFYGEWIFRDCPNGTDVIINIYLKVGIPAIKEFADTYTKKLVTRNFEVILEAAERRLISTRYASYRKGESGKIAGFGIVGHLYNYYHLERCFHILNPTAKIPSREFLGQLFNLSPSFKLYDIPEFRSKMGDVTNGCFIVATFIPDMIEKDIWTIFSKVVRACKIAEKNGVGIVTLGGFASIVAERIGQEIINEVEVPVTTGNTFTAAMTIDGVLKAANLLNMDIANAKIAIIGGTGDIGSACARVLSEKARQLIVTGRTKSNLRRLNAELTKKHKAKITATIDNRSAVREADVVIAAASATQSILDVGWFKPGSIICDVGYPKNVSYTSTTRQDIFIFSGGLTKPPAPIRIPIDMGLPSDDVIYGCFAEGVILALEKRYENFSFGRGNITTEKVDEMRAMGKRHGFELADFYWGDKLMDESMIAKVKETINV